MRPELRRRPQRAGLLRGRLVRLGSGVLALILCVALLGCTDQARLDQVKRTLKLSREGSTHFFRTPEGCEVEVIILGKDRVRVYRVDDRPAVYANPTGTVAVKAVLLSKACRALIVRRLDTIP